MNWYYSEAGKAHGPFTEDKLSELAHGGTISTETLIWKPGMEEWKPVIIALPSAIHHEHHLKKTAPVPLARPQPNPFAEEAVTVAAKQPGFFQRFFGKGQKT